MYKISKEFKFEMAHMLSGHDGKCLNLHGHSYRMQVYLKAHDLASDMVLDYTDLKKIVKKLIIDKVDHAFGYNKNSNDKVELEIAQLLIDNGRLVYTFDSRATAENMAEHFYKVLKTALSNSNFSLSSVVVFETDTTSAEYKEVN